MALSLEVSEPVELLSITPQVAQSVRVKLKEEGDLSLEESSLGESKPIQQSLEQERKQSLEQGKPRGSRLKTQRKAHSLDSAQGHHKETAGHLENPSGRARMFGVTCNFGTDDFFFLPLLTAAIRLTWFACGVTLCVYSFLLPQFPACSSIHVPITLTVSLLGFLVLQLVTIILYAVTTILASRGSLLRPQPRRHVVVPAYMLLLLSAVELGWLIFSTYSAVAASPSDGMAGVGGEESSGSAGEASGSVWSNMSAEEGGSGAIESSGSGMSSGSGTMDFISCSSYDSVVLLFSILVATAWLLYIAILLSFFFLLDPCGLCLGSTFVKQIAKKQKYHQEDYSDAAKKSLNDYNKFDSVTGRYGNAVNYSLLCSKLRQTFCFCFRRDGLKSSRADALSDVVQALRILFSDVDVTFSDLLAGFLLASLYQRRLKESNKDRDHELTEATLKLLKEKNQVPKHYTIPPPKVLTPVEGKKWAAELNKYFEYCKATYGCPIHIYLHPCSGPLSLCIAAKGCCCCCCNICQLEHFEGDTCYPNTAAIQEIAGVYPEEIITASFINSVYKVPYYAAYDEDDKRLVVAIRGTLSIQDALTDVSVSMWEIPEGLLGVKPAYVHKGFFESAHYMYQALMARPRFRDKLNDVREFVITGHSLGAAVAAVLTVLFKDRHSSEAWSSTLRAVTFSTPAAVMSYQLAEKTTDFVISVVGGHDLVSRMTMRSLGYMKLLVSTMLSTVDHPKHQVLCCSGSGRAQCCTPYVNEEEDILGLAYSKEELRSVESLDLAGDMNVSFRRLKTYLPFLDDTVTWDPAWREEETREVVRRINHQVNLVNGGAQDRDERPAMFLPGRILHLEDSEEYGINKWCGLKKRRKVRATWKPREAISTILVHKDMLLDHTPHRVASMLERFQLYPDRTIPKPYLHDQTDDESLRRRVYTA